MDDQSIDDLPLGKPYKQKLHAANLKTIGELKRAIAANTLVRPGIGAESAQHIKNALAAFERDHAAQSPAPSQGSPVSVTVNTPVSVNNPIAINATNDQSIQPRPGVRRRPSWKIRGVWIAGVFGIIAVLIPIYKGWLPWVKEDKTQAAKGDNPNRVPKGRYDRILWNLALCYVDPQAMPAPLGDKPRITSKMFAELRCGYVTALGILEPACEPVSAKIPIGWVSFGDRLEVPAGAAYSGHRGETFVWVMPEHSQEPETFASIIEHIENSPLHPELSPPPTHDLGKVK